MIAPETEPEETTIQAVAEDDDQSQDESNEPEKGVKKSEIELKKAGVVYLSRIPTKMNVRIIREYLSKFGEVDRVFLEPREKKRKNEQRTFSEGWVEFKRKKHAKQAANALNNNPCGGKRKNPWYSELWNVKYLKKFRWTHLNERMAYEQELRKQRLRQEIQLAKKETSYYIQNYEKNEKKKRVDKKSENSGETNPESGPSTSAGKTDSDDEPRFNKRPKLYERKTKVVGNDSFLSQIFS